MAYAYPLNPAVPADGDLASQGDDQLRLIKNVIRERIGTIVVDIDADPLVLKPTVFPAEFSTGTLASRVNPPTAANLLFYASDSDQLFFSRSDGGAGFEWVEAKPAEEEDAAVLAISAGEARFAPLGTETRATKVANAINTAKLTDAAVKVVYVPKALWGYVADLDFDVTMFDTGVLLAREGSLVSWYDPIAYGADNTGTTNSRSVINICYTHAAATAQGVRMVAFTVPGTYLMTTDVAQLDVPLFLGAGCTLSGAGVLTGDRPFRVPPDPVPESNVVTAISYNPAAAAGSRATEVTIVQTLHLHIPPTATNASGELTVDFSDASFDGVYDLTKAHTIVASEWGASGDANEAVRVAVAGQVLTLKLDGGSQTGEWDLVITFTE